MKDRGVRSCGDEKCEIKWGGREVGLGSKGFFVARERQTIKAVFEKGFETGVQAKSYVRRPGGRASNRSGG